MWRTDKKKKKKRRTTLNDVFKVVTTVVTKVDGLSKDMEVVKDDIHNLKEDNKVLHQKMDQMSNDIEHLKVQVKRLNKKVFNEE